MSEKISLNTPLAAPAVSEVPTERVPLPSKGLVYPEGHPFHGKDSVEIKSMTAHEEDILTSQALLKSGKVLSTLLRSCLIDRSIDPGLMLLGDRDACLVAIRITGYGREYSATVDCPECLVANEISVDLASLPIKNIPEDVSPDTAGTNEFSLVLPSKRTAIVKLLTGQDEEQMFQITQAQKKNNIQDSTITTRLAAHLVVLDGQRNPGFDKIQNLSARDSRYLRKFIEHASPGVELKTAFSCRLCGHSSQEVSVPMGTGFFWPEA